MYAWLLEKLTSKLAVPLLGVLLLTNIVSGVGLAITRHTLTKRTDELALERKIHAQDLAAVAATTTQAEASDTLNSAVTVKKQDGISQESQNEIQSNLAAAHAAAARIVRPRPANSGGEGSNLPGSPDAPDGADGPSAGAWFSAADVDACAVSYTVAKGWQDWWNKEYPVMLEGSRDPSVAQVSLSQPPALGAVLVDRDRVAAGGRHLPAAQGDLGPVDLMEAVHSGHKAAVVAESEHAPGHDTGGAEQNNVEPDHKNFLP